MNNYSSLQPTFLNWDLHNKTVLLRVDFNMTFFQGSFLSDFKIRRTQKTIDYLLDRGASIKLITHQEPQAPFGAVVGSSQQSGENSDSTKPLVEWFIQHGYPASFSTEVNVPVQPGSVMIVENIRIFPGEKTKDLQQAHTLAQQIAAHTNYYVFDAFGVCHRNDTSVALLPTLFKQEHRSIGFLVEDEITQLQTFMAEPAHPFIALCAGNKKDKLEYIKNIPGLDTILLGPLLCFETENIQSSKKLTTPSDYITKSDIKIIGSETTQKWSSELSQAGTILCNGLMGILEQPETLVPFDHLLQAIAESQGSSLICGGSTVSYLDYKGLLNNFSFNSTGGGATLAYLAHAPLPGLSTF